MSAEAISGKQLISLREALRNYGRSRFPSLRDEVDDLVAQTITDLWEYLNTYSGDGKNGLDEDSIRKISFSIFKRRVVDFFRRNARRWALSVDDAPEIETVGTEPVDNSTLLLYKRALKICLAELSLVADEDKLLLSIVVDDGDEAASARTPRERQRLHRLRKRLSSAIRNELGEDAKKILRDEA